MKHNSLVIILLFSTSFLMFAMESEKPKWDADKYEQGSDRQFKGAMHALQAIKLEEYNSILDIGCGTGKVTLAMAQQAPDAYILGTDFSKAMIEKAQEKESEHLSFKQMDAQKNSLTYHFDLITSFAALHWMKDKKAVFEGISRCLKPGGTLLLTCTQKDPHHPLMKVCEDLKQDEKWGPLFSKADINAQYFPLDGFELKELAEDVQLNIKELKSEGKNLEPFKSESDFKTFFMGFIGGFPAVSQLNETHKSALVDTIIKKFLEYRPANPDGSIEYGMSRLQLLATKK